MSACTRLKLNQRVLHSKRRSTWDGPTACTFVMPSLMLQFVCVSISRNLSTCRKQVFPARRKLWNESSVLTISTWHCKAYIASEEYPQAKRQQAVLLKAGVTRFAKQISRQRGQELGLFCCWSLSPTKARLCGRSCHKLTKAQATAMLSSNLNTT
eukprot:713582-Amphidinium_carterae.1